MIHSGGQRDAAVLSTSLPVLSFWCLHWPPLKAPAFFCLSGRRNLLLLPLRSLPLCPSSLRDISKRVSPDHSCLFDALITRLPPSPLLHARARSALRGAHRLPLMEKPASEWSDGGVIGSTHDLDMQRGSAQSVRPPLKPSWLYSSPSSSHMTLHFPHH